MLRINDENNDALNELLGDDDTNAGEDLLDLDDLDAYMMKRQYIITKRSKIILKIKLNLKEICKKKERLKPIINYSD